MAGAKTIFEKIWDQHVVAERDDGEVLLYIDRLLLQENSFHAFDKIRREKRAVRNPGQAFDQNLGPGVYRYMIKGFLDQHSPADYFGDDERFPWAEQIFPVQTVQGLDRRWSVAIWQDAPADIDFDRETACYDAYLRSL